MRNFPVRKFIPADVLGNGKYFEVFKMLPRSTGKRRYPSTETRLVTFESYMKGRTKRE